MDNKNASDETLVFVSGLFNILHPGHFRFLKFAREQGDRLVIAVLSDRQAPEATLPEDERLANVQALSFVDEAFLLEDSPASLISELKPDIVVKGWEHHDKDSPEKKVLDTYGGRLIFSSGDIKLSGLHGNEGGADQTLASAMIKPVSYLKRHSIAGHQIDHLLEKFGSLNVCVIGDIIVDNYLNCQPVGMSREDPTIVVRPAGNSRYIGGAAIVAAHASSLGGAVNFISVCGEDEAGAYSRKRLSEIGVEHHIFEDKSRPTTQKTRYRASGKTLLRVNEYADHPISAELSDKIIQTLKKLVCDIDVLIFSDFSYGALPQELVKDITVWARDKDIVVAADSQSSSQIGDISRFKNLTLVTPTEHEARLALYNFTDGLVKIGDKMQEKTGADHVIVTLGEDGVFIKATPVAGDETVNDRIPALQTAARDVSGAGDALLVSSSMALAAGATIWEAAYIGSLASAVQVSREGNVPMTQKELREALAP